MSTNPPPKVFHGMPRRHLTASVLVGDNWIEKRIVHVIPKGDPKPMGYGSKVQQVKVAFADGTTIMGTVYLP